MRKLMLGSDSNYEKKAIRKLLKTQLLTRHSMLLNGILGKEL